MKKGLAALRWLGWAGLAVPAGRLMVTKELCNWFVIASPPSTIYTVDIYTVDIYTVISTVLARPGCSSVDDGWWSYPATPHRPPQPIIDSLVVESTAWARPGLVITTWPLQWAHGHPHNTAHSAQQLQPATCAGNSTGVEMICVLYLSTGDHWLGWAGLGWAGVGAEHF